MGRAPAPTVFVCLSNAVSLYARNVDLGWFLGNVGSVARPATLPVQVRNTLWNCFSRALEHASLKQGQNAEAISAMLIEEIKVDEPRLSALLSTDLSHPTSHATWTNALHGALTESSLDLSDVDFGRFCRAAFDRYVAEVEADAKRPDSKLTNALSISMLTARAGSSSVPEPNAPTGPSSNLWRRPRPAKIRERPAMQSAESHLARRGSAHLIGGPGSGKSVVARLVAERAMAASAKLSVWWMDCSTREALATSCAELCTEFGVAPAEDVLEQAKALLAHNGEWLVVLDDLGADVRAEEVIPSSTPSVRMLVTARSSLDANPDRLVLLDEADRELMVGIARDALAGTGPDSSLDSIVEACDMNPLAIATVCRYLAATAASSQDVLELLKERPDVVLDEALGGHYPRTFTTVVATALERIHGTVAEDLLVALALADGRLRRSDLTMIAAPEDQLAFLDGLRELRSMGLIEASEELIHCHALLASIVVRKSDDQLIEYLVERTLATITAEAPEAGVLELHEYVRLADALNGDSSIPTVFEVGAMTALATRLSLFGLGRTADRHLTRAHGVIADAPDDTLHALLTVTEAVVLLQRGELNEAERLARRALAHLTDDRTEHEVAFDIYMQAALCIAQIRAYFEDWERAAEHAQYAVDASVGDPDIEAFALKMQILTRDARGQLVGLLQLADTQELSPTSRAESLALASRAALTLEDPDQAVNCARRALAIDTAETGSDSQFAARDLNDLGSALFAAGELTEAASRLREAISIYEAELPEHGYAVQPRMHLARVLTEQAQHQRSCSATLFKRALDTLAPAIAVQRRIGPSTVEMTSLLVAQANATTDHAAAIEMLREALEIDRQLYGDGHPEVCIDVIQLAGRHFAIKSLEDAADDLLIAVPHVGNWEMERPSLAVEVHSLFLLVRIEQEPTELIAQDIHCLRKRLERLLLLIPQNSAGYALAEAALAAEESKRHGQGP